MNETAILTHVLGSVNPRLAEFLEEGHEHRHPGLGLNRLRLAASLAVDPPHGCGPHCPLGENRPGSRGQPCRLPANAAALLPCQVLQPHSGDSRKPSRDAWVPARVYPLPRGAPHLCSWWDHPPAPPCQLSPAGELDPSPTLLAEQPAGSLTARTRAPGLFQPRGLHTTRQVCGPGGDTCLPPPCLFTFPGRGLQT